MKLLDLITNLQEIRADKHNTMRMQLLKSRLWETEQNQKCKNKSNIYFQIKKPLWRRKWQSSSLAWEIPWTEEPGGLLSMGSQTSHTQLSDGNNNKS